MLKKNKRNYHLVQTGLSDHGFEHVNIYVDDNLLNMLLNHNRLHSPVGDGRFLVTKVDNLSRYNPRAEDVLNNNTYIKSEFFDYAKKSKNIKEVKGEDGRYFYAKEEKNGYSLANKHLLMWVLLLFLTILLPVASVGGEIFSLVSAIKDGSNGQMILHAIFMPIIVILAIILEWMNLKSLKKMINNHTYEIRRVNLEERFQAHRAKMIKEKYGKQIHNSENWN